MSIVRASLHEHEHGGGQMPYLQLIVYTRDMDIFVLRTRVMGCLVI